MLHRILQKAAIQASVEINDWQQAQRLAQDIALDEALELTFPASDPVACHLSRPTNLEPLSKQEYTT